MSDIHLTQVELSQLCDHNYPTYEIDLNGIELDEDIEHHIQRVLKAAYEEGHPYVNLYIKRIHA